MKNHLGQEVQHFGHAWQEAWISRVKDELPGWEAHTLPDVGNGAEFKWLERRADRPEAAFTVRVTGQDADELIRFARNIEADLP